MKHILYIITILFISHNLSGQARYFDERYISTLSLLNPVIINPGATGLTGNHKVSANYKNKWATFPGSPKSYLVSYDGPLVDRLGFGILASTDSNGSLETTKVQGSLSYRIESANNVIGAGITGEYINHNVSGDVLTNRYVDSGDVLVQSRVDGNGFFDVSLGLYGIFDQRITYGIALPSLASSMINGEANDAFDREVGFIANIGYIYSPANVDAIFEPSLFIKQLNNVPFHADINLLGRFGDDKFRGGVTYTVGGDERVGFIIGGTFNALGLNYSYNASRHEFQTYNNGTHEFSIQIDISGSSDKRNNTSLLDEILPEQNLESNK